MLIKIHNLINHFQLKITGILHIGAHECEEMEDYINVGVMKDKIYWVEAMPDKVNFCRARYGAGLNIYSAVIDVQNDKKVTFNITNNGQSSSILEFGSHAISHPLVHIIDKVEMTTTRLDRLIEHEHIPISQLNFLNLDIQGVELRALKSMEKYLQHVNYIYTEVNTEQVYKDCNLIGEIDDYLHEFGFVRVAQQIYKEYGWGDAFYMKK
jgi:FkbM family methyltransferase